MTLYIEVFVLVQRSDLAGFSTAWTVLTSGNTCSPFFTYHHQSAIMTGTISYYAAVSKTAGTTAFLSIAWLSRIMTGAELKCSMSWMLTPSCLVSRQHPKYTDETALNGLRLKIMKIGYLSSHCKVQAMPVVVVNTT